MKKLFSVFIAFTGILCLLAGCGKADSKDFAKTLTTAFEKVGYHAQYAQGSKNILEGERSVLTLSKGTEDAIVQIYTYPSPKAAAEDLSRLNDDGFSYTVTDGEQGHAINVDWIDKPHFYIKSSVIVLYVGSDGTLCEILQSFCGEQAKGM